MQTGTIPLAIALTLLILSIVLNPLPPYERPASGSIPKGMVDANQLKISTSYFIMNMGQIPNEEVMFYSRSGNIFFTPSGVVYRIREIDGAMDEKIEYDAFIDSRGGISSSYHERGVVLKYTFIGSKNVIPIGRERCSWNSNYFKGNVSENWMTDVPNFLEVIYNDLWDGIDLVYRLHDGCVKYDLIVHPWADPSRIGFQVDGHSGLSLNEEGSLVLGTGLWDILDTGLVAFYGYGMDDRIECDFKIMSHGSFGFELGSYDRSRFIVIDPIIYSTFIGGSINETAFDITIDTKGNVYITGYTYSPDYPTTIGAYDTSLNSISKYPGDVVVTKLDPTCSFLIYSTFIGGTDDNYGKSIAVDQFGNAYISGRTKSEDYPVTSNAFDTSHNGEYDVFVTKLDPTGSSLIYSTYLGGNARDSNSEIRVDSFYNAYVCGGTMSDDFPTTVGAFNTTYSSLPYRYEVFVTKLDPTGSTLIYSTYIGGRYEDFADGLAVDAFGNAYITGCTLSDNYPTTIGAYSNIHNNPNMVEDVFVTKLDPTGSSLIFSTLIGGGGDDYADGIVVDLDGDVYITGRTYVRELSRLYPTTEEAYDTTQNGGGDVFITKLNRNGSSLIYSTYIGGIKNDVGTDIGLDPHGNIIITGVSQSPDYPTTIWTHDWTYNGERDVIVSKFDPTLSYLLYSTYLGAEMLDTGNGIVIDESGHAYITGRTDYARSSFPTTAGAFQTVHDGLQDIFVTKLNMTIDPNPPVFGSDNSDEIATTGDPFNFEIEVWDDIGLSGVSVEYWFGSSPTHKASMGFSGNYIYQITIPSNSLDELHYRFIAVDAFMNKANTSDRVVPVTDNDGPDFGTDSTPGNITYGGSLTFSVEVFDNIEISIVYVNYRLGSGDYENVSMFRSGDYQHTMKIPIDSPDRLYYYFSAVDTSGNWNNTKEREVVVVDDRPPTFGRDLTPDEIGTGEVLEFCVEAFDNIELSSVYVEYWFGSGERSNESMSGSDVFRHNITIPSNSTDRLYYIFHALDRNNNWAGMFGSVLVEDTIPPVAVIVSERTVNEDTPFILDGSLSSDNIGITSWVWRIDIGPRYVIDLGERIEHIFEDPGIYTVSLKVTDSSDNWDIASIQLTVLDITLPVADAGGDRDIEEGLVLFFDGSGSLDNVGIVNWTWTFIDGDQIILYGVDPSYRFDTLGVYTVVLNVTDPAGLWNIDSMTVTVRDITPPVADAGEDLTIDEGDTVQFDGNGSHDNVEIVNYTWSFYDGSSKVVLYGVSPSHIFSIPRTYTVTLTVKDEAGNEGSDTMKVEVKVKEGNGNGIVDDPDDIWLFILGSIFVVVVILLIGWFLLFRRKKNGEEE